MRSWQGLSGPYPEVYRGKSVDSTMSAVGKDRGLECNVLQQDCLEETRDEEIALGKYLKCELDQSEAAKTDDPAPSRKFKLSFFSAQQCMALVQNVKLVIELQ